MSSDGSPIRFSSRADYLDLDGGFDPSFSAEINSKMRVPKKIRVASGDLSDTDEPTTNWAYTNGNGIGSDRIAMQVPDRILVTGHDRHIGAKALPRELQLENKVMPADPEYIRIQTPPRSIRLHEQQILNDRHANRNLEAEDETMVVENNQARFIPNSGRLGNSDTSLVLRAREGSVGGYYDGEDVQAELEHLREQMGRINQRLLATETEVSSMREREQYLWMGAVLCLSIHVCSWLFRSGSNR